jgi:hypothetical protein
MTAPHYRRYSVPFEVIKLTQPGRRPEAATTRKMHSHAAYCSAGPPRKGESGIALPAGTPVLPIFVSPKV